MAKNLICGQLKKDGEPITDVVEAEQAAHTLGLAIGTRAKFVENAAPELGIYNVLVSDQHMQRYEEDGGITLRVGHYKFEAEFD